MKLTQVQRLSARTARIGVCVTRTYSAETTTHFLLDAYPSELSACNARILTGLLNAVRFVNSGWLERLLVLGESPKKGEEPNLEEEWRTFEEDFKPKVEGSANEYIWEELDNRKDLLRTLRFVVLHDGATVRAFFWSAYDRTSVTDR